MAFYLSVKSDTCFYTLDIRLLVTNKGMKNLNVYHISIIYINKVTVRLMSVYLSVCPPLLSIYLQIKRDKDIPSVSNTNIDGATLPLPQLE